MKVLFYQQEYPVNIDDIQKAENLYGRSFPIEYKEYLLKYNGGVSYPNYPTIKTDNNFELWQIDMFYSLGDIIVRKHQLLNAKHPEHDEEELSKYDLNNEDLLPFAKGERGWYFMDLSDKGFGQLYFYNYSGGDGIVRIESKSFKQFTSTLGFPEWSESKYDPERELKMSDYIPYKITQQGLFYTPSNPDIGLQHFKKVFEYFKQKQAPETTLKNLSRTYVNERDKLEYLLKQGCNKDGLLIGGRVTFQTVIYLVNNFGIELNKAYNGRYPIQSFLTPSSTADIKVRYQLIHDLIAAGLEFDWNIRAKLYADSEEMTALEMLSILNDKYRKYESDENERWLKDGKPQGHVPFFKSEHIDNLIKNINP